MSDKDFENGSEELPEETPAETASELVEEKIESEGELTAASAEKEYAGLIREEHSEDGVTEEGKKEETGTEAEETGEETGEKTGEKAGDEESEADTTPRARGLYRYVKISLPTLNKLIVVLCAALVICLIYGMSNRGYMVDFDSRGGTPVESEKLMYSDKVIPPEEPYREGYTFTGWYTNADCTEEWDLDTGLVGGPMTLYAGWEEKTQ